MKYSTETKIMFKPRLVFASVCLLSGFSFASAGSIFNAQGLVDRTNYTYEALTWTGDAISDKLGPTFTDVNGNITDNRPTLYKPTSHTYSGYTRINPWELGTAPAKDTDYWSDSGQVGYVPDIATDAGLDRVALYAYYSKVFALSPRLDWASGTPHSDPQTRDTGYATMNGEAPKQPIAMARGYGLTQNEAIVLYRDGLMGVAGTQTSRAGADRPYPGLMFPDNKIATGIAITTENEFALITVWDTTALKGQLAVVALEGKYLPSHTMPYMGLPNQGSWSAFKLLGYIDLPMAAPSSISAASNGFWTGPSQTGGKDLGALTLSVDANRTMLYTSGMIAQNGYAIVASKQENKVAIVDLTPLFAYMRSSWLSSAASFNATLAARGTAASQFPQTFDVRPSIKPTVIWEATYPKPTAVLAGSRVDRWSKDRLKAYIATEEGTVHIIDASPLLWRASWQIKGTLGEIGSFDVGNNPISMCFARRDVKNLPLIPANSNSGIPDCYNSVFWVACRGDRAVKACHAFQGQGQVHMTIRDSRMTDPVAVSTAVRGPILTVADYSGKKILSFRVGDIVDSRNKVTYKCGPNGTDKFEFAGELALPGKPFLIGSANVN